MVVGTSNLAAGEQGGSFRWEDGVMVAIGPTDRGTGAIGVNSRGEIVGIMGPGPDAVGGERANRFGYRLARREALRGFSGVRYNTVEVSDISDRGLIVGYEYDPRDDVAFEPTVWEDGVAIRLPKPAGTDTGALGVNRAGDVVGFSASHVESSGSHAVVWRRR